jgi:hypothetical protein
MKAADERQTTGGPGESEHCSSMRCSEPVAAVIEGENFCRRHFIDTSYMRLELYESMLKTRTVGAAETESIRRFIHECSRQADEIENSTSDLDNLDRAKLLHIILTASELGRYLRRSPRKVATIPVHLACDRLGGAWEENGKTVLLSRFGAAVQCRHPAKIGEYLHVMRFDTGQKVEARVAWQRFLGNEGARIGIEFVNCDNFWGLDWAAVEEAR